MFRSILAGLAAGVFGAMLNGVNGYTPEALADQVTALPGAENLEFSFNQFSGYLTVNQTKQMHYWMVESAGNPATDPVVFWTNGGPGCSGLLGFLGEQGPFRPNADLSLSLNEFSWNNIANMVFVEQPCGVGFSTSTAEDTSFDYSNNDAQAATDNYFMLQAFFERYPEYKGNDLYYTSESYGGHYMPTLAKEIVDQNAAGVYPKLNYKGFAVGNPATTFHSTTPAMLEMYWGHQVVAKPTWDKYTKECVDYVLLPNLTICEALFMDMYLQIGGLNPYAIDYPVCTEDSPRRGGRAQRHWMLENIFYNASTELRNAVGLGANSVGLEPVAGYEPCEEDYMTAWINQASVKEALHVKGDIEWEQCSRKIRYKQSDGHNSMVPYYQYLIDGNFGLNILVYSGDDDSVCATVGTQSWIWGMGYDVSGRMWQPYTLDGQTAGYFTAWKDTKLGFLTVHGAGHEVPTYKPAVALDMFKRYLAGEWTSA